MIRSAAAALCLVLVACDGRPETAWLTRPQFSVGPWDVYHDTRLNITEINYVRDSVARHIALSEATLGRAPGSFAPRWLATLPNARGSIRLYSAKVQFLNGPLAVGVRSYVDWKRQEVHAVVGFKFTLPELAEAVHELREGPDPYQQDPSLGWSTLLAAQTALVDQLERSRP
tara:strand:- start:66 stop:581 length:516 start_codon:yes stop_codon:yes gene_type:complete